jgi:GTPase SAR1 family protein
MNKIRCLSFVSSFVVMDPRLKHPFTCVVAGPSSSGKTQFVFRLIRHADRLVDPPPEKIMYCYGEFQPSFLELPQVEFHEGLPNVDSFDGRSRVLLIIDDLMNEADQNVCNLFTKLSHHRNVSVVFVTQNLFHRNRHVRTMNLNTHYVVLFKNPRDAGQVANLARQMYPGKSNFVVEAFRDATREPYGYLLIDLKPETEERYRIRTNIFPDDERQYVYVPKV